ncbi:MAG: hypothetical protein QGI86_12475 [Candidatus Poribacteria bacterium]|jgi:hypothetical protein|nr:hypothetical protein [Candidatus Poribacteria bacterium]MDP6748499.1 hypothetical protein [Candidatus Poribacteria bacterium]MDP6997373.1 hypothetical protein [Candidatus Poribacteria bacterium]
MSRTGKCWFLLSVGLILTNLVGCGEDKATTKPKIASQIVDLTEFVGMWHLNHYEPHPTTQLPTVTLMLIEDGTWQSETKRPLTSGGYLSVQARGRFRIEADLIKSETEQVTATLPTSQLEAKTQVFQGEITFQLEKDLLTLYYSDGSIAVYQRQKNGE